MVGIPFGFRLPPPPPQKKRKLNKKSQHTNKQKTGTAKQENPVKSPASQPLFIASRYKLKFNDTIVPPNQKASVLPRIARND